MFIAVKSIIHVYTYFIAILAIVLFDYDAEATDEHTLRVGDVLTNVKKIEEGWCQGMLKGKSGMFPDNFVKVDDSDLLGLCSVHNI